MFEKKLFNNLFLYNINPFLGANICIFEAVTPAREIINKICSSVVSSLRVLIDCTSNHSCFSLNDPFNMAIR